MVFGVAVENFWASEPLSMFHVEQFRMHMDQQRTMFHVEHEDSARSLASRS